MAKTRTHDELKQQSLPESGAASVMEAVEVSSTTDEHSNDEQHDDLEKQTTRTSATAQPPLTKVTTAQDWAGPDDPDNPLNWSLLKKGLHFWPTALLAFSATTASSLITPANQDLQRDFGITRTMAILPLTLYVIGLGLGPAIAAPISEQFGRAVVYKFSVPISILFLMGSGLSKSFASLCVCRLLAGTAGAPVLAVGSGTNADLFVVKDRAVSSALFIMMPFMGPAFGPVIGGFAAQFRGWRWTIWCMIIMSGVTYLTCLPMHETYKKTILQKRAKRLGLPPPPGPKVMSVEYMKVMVTITLLRPISMIFTEPLVLAFGIYNSFTFAILFSFFAAFPYTFTTVYGFNTYQNGLVFISIGLGVVLGVIVAILCDKLLYQKHHKQAIEQGKAMLPPEQRLYAGFIGAFCLPVGLFWFAWSARSDVHWIVSILAGIPFALGNVSLFLASVMYMMDVYGPMNGASAMAANGLMRYVTGACFPLFAIQMYERLGVAWATSLLAFLCIAMLPIPFVFFRWGPQIRRTSRYNAA